MAADASPGDSWLTWLIRLGRISEVDAGCAVKIRCPLYLELSFGMLRELVNLQGLKRNVVKRQMDKIMTSSRCTQSATPSIPEATTTTWTTALGAPMGQTTGGDDDPCAVYLGSAGLCWALLYYRWLGFEDWASSSLPIQSMQPTCQTTEPTGSTCLSPAMMPKECSWLYLEVKQHVFLQTFFPHSKYDR